jgi:hypothetical protein
MGLDGFSGSSDEGNTSQTKTTYFQFENPDHPDSKEFDDPESAAEHYEAARYIQDKLGPDRHNLVGNFILGVYHLEENDDAEKLQNVVSQLRD